jgi:hypothetical protein
MDNSHWQRKSLLLNYFATWNFSEKIAYLPFESRHHENLSPKGSVFLIQTTISPIGFVYNHHYTLGLYGLDLGSPHDKFVRSVRVMKEKEKFAES